VKVKGTADRKNAGLLAPAERDLRLDLMRGIGQWMVFLDHIPYDTVSWLTIRNYGFSDAAEFFVFISGYTAGFVYGPAMVHGQFLGATKRLLKRAWQLYIAPVFARGLAQTPLYGSRRVPQNNAGGGRRRPQSGQGLAAKGRLSLEA
jgi:hypothetical protein